MNLKKFFYQDYYHFEANVEVKERGQTVLVHRKFDLKKSSNDADWKQIKEYNEPLLKVANASMCNYRLSQAASEQLDFQKTSGRPTQTISLKTTYPGLFTGSGYNHETGNTGEFSLGFFFDHTTGLPILPGSSVKGVLRSVFPRFKKMESNPLKPDLHQTSELQTNKAQFVAALFSIPKYGQVTDYEKVHRLELSIFEGVNVPETEASWKETREQEGREASEKSLFYLPMSMHDVFLDAFISKPGKGGKILGTDALTPHGDDPLKNPTPLPFLKVLPDVEFTFQFLLRDTVLDDLTTISAERKRSVFEIILTTFGAGAKTNVGYGQFITSGGENLGNDGSGESYSQREPAVFTKNKARIGDPAEAKVIADKSVEIKTATGNLTVKMTGNCPEIGTVVKVQVNGVDGKGTITQVSFQGVIKS